jgi:hypothetical protein
MAIGSETSSLQDEDKTYQWLLRIFGIGRKGVFCLAASPAKQRLSPLGSPRLCGENFIWNKHGYN